MLANFLEKSKPINFILLILLFFCLYSVISWKTLFENGVTFYPFFKLLCYLGLFIIIFFFFNFIITKNNLTKDNSFAYFIFTLFLSYFISGLTHFKTVSILIIYILFLRKVYSFKSPKKILQKLFDSGFWLGILFILEPYMALFLLLIYIAVFLHQKIIINTILTPFVGFITPLILYFTYCFWYEETYLFTNLFYFDTFQKISFFSNNYFNWVALILLSFTIISIVLKSPRTLSINNSFRKSWILLIFHLTICFIFSLLNTSRKGYELLYLIFPASVIIANGIEVINSKIGKNLILFIILVSAFLFPFLL